jgi:DNA-binding PadR family transcriptional regulator
MTVPQSLLAILAQGRCYGYQLRAEFERRTGGSALNVGQVYATLDRLERDGLAAKGVADASGHVYYEITASGRSEAQRWLSSAVEQPGRDELAVKLALAVTLPGVDARPLIEAQRAVTAATLRCLRDEVAVDLARELVIDARVLAAEAELRWLDRCESRLVDSVPYGLEIEPPRRGRPVRA